MGELRKDYVMDRWVIISSKRQQRPNEFLVRKAEKKVKTVCAFCKGNEHLTPKETYRVEDDGEWIIRCFPNKFPAVSMDKKPKLVKHDSFFLSSFAYGRHEVIVDHPWENKQIEDLGIDHIKKLLETYANRTKEFYKDKNIKYVAVFKNYEKEAGTSIKHSHTQIIGYNHVSRVLLQEVEAVNKYKSCPYCSIMKVESKGPRRVVSNKNVVCFAPYASRYPYELVIFPRRHVINITQLNEDELLDMAVVIKKLLLRLRTINAAYNMYVHNAPIGKNLHFHIKINPRLSIFGGFELSTGTIINTVAPEYAAKFYRGK